MLAAERLIWRVQACSLLGRYPVPVGRPTGVTGVLEDARRLMLR